jgi:endonuclease YncB( thermonuclease family)
MVVIFVCCNLMGGGMRKILVPCALALTVISVAAQQDNDFRPEPVDREEQPAGVKSETPSRESLVNFVLNGTVHKIEDGDTITIQGVQNKFRVRFSDMDTPEVSHEAWTPPDCKCAPIPYRPGQPGGQSARKSLLEILSIGDAVRAECYEMDQYGRSVCHVFKQNTNVNLEQIRRGWGWLATKSAWIRDTKESKAAAAEAQASSRGAWALPGQVHPDEWRKQCWGPAKQCPNAEK